MSGKAVELFVVGVRVVVGDCEEVEGEVDGVADDLFDGVEAVGVDGVAVEVAFEPAVRVPSAECRVPSSQVRAPSFRLPVSLFRCSLFRVPVA
jgi:hypothetical protein